MKEIINKIYTKHPNEYIWVLSYHISYVTDKDIANFLIKLLLQNSTKAEIIIGIVL
jgi:hypothetical protein